MSRVFRVLAACAAASLVACAQAPADDSNLDDIIGGVDGSAKTLNAVGTLGVKAIIASPDPNGVLVTTAVRALGSGVAKLVTGALIIALALSSLNAIMGCARSLYMMALDGQAPRIFGRVNRHNVPDFSMGLNVILNILLIFAGTPGAIYVLSNVGYVGSFVPVLLGYYFLRRWRPEIHRPYRLPEVARQLEAYHVVSSEDVVR